MDQKTKQEMLEKLSWIENTAQNENEDYIETMAASLREAIEEAEVTEKPLPEMTCERCGKSFTPPDEDHYDLCPKCVRETTPQ